MGGYGSGRQPWAFNFTVEDSLALDVNYLVRNKRRTSGLLTWSRCGTPTASIWYQLNLADEYVRLYYTWRKTEQIDYEVQLVRKLPFFGGVQYFFLCPRCSRQAMKLYSAPGSKYFQCRTCQHLTYQSCRESHKYDKMFARLAAGSGLTAKEFKNALKD